jgi:hypothetical protein
MQWLIGCIMNRNEVSLSRVFSILKRMEKKLDALPTGAAAQPFSTNQLPCETSSNGISSPAGRAEENNSSNTAYAATSPVDTISFDKTAPLTETIFSVPKTRISFSAHMTLDAIADAPCFRANSPLKNHHYKLASPATLELGQQSMYTDFGATVPMMLETLPFMTIKELSNAYFATWNRVYPIVDRDYYFAYTLNLVAQDGFDYNMESCVVLMVMALGCLGEKAYVDGGFSRKGAACLAPLDAYISRFLEEPVPGESLVAESSKRVGFCLCDTSIQSCQYYLLRATFYEQTAKPMDEWMMITRACTVSVALSKYADIQLDEWKADMQSRLFWICLLREAVVVDEMELVPSGLQDLAEQTPLPRFVRYPIQRPRAKDDDDSHYHYHFLAQLALRIIITRIRNELYNTEPSPFVAEELFSQLYQWCDNLPTGLKFSENNAVQPHEPAEAVATMLLRTRYTLAIYHISRPFLIKAIRFPLETTDHEIRICSEAMKCAMEWPIGDRKSRQLKTFMPVKYFACAQ